MGAGGKDRESNFIIFMNVVRVLSVESPIIHTVNIFLYYYPDLITVVKLNK